MTEQLIQTVTDRSIEMLKNPAIARIYNAMPKGERNRWLVKAAIATLKTPVNDRTK